MDIILLFRELIAKDSKVFLLWAVFPMTLIVSGIMAV